MIFFCNTKITEEIPRRGPQPYDRGLLKSSNKLDVFKYSIASLSKIYQWKRVIIYYELDNLYKPRQKELEDFIRDEFKGHDLVLRNRRNSLQKDWEDMYELLNDELIWFYCNHDHIFMDSEYSYFRQVVEDMRLYNDELCSLGFSHWPETIRNASKLKDFKLEDSHFSGESLCYDSIQVINKKLYHAWWCTKRFPHPLPRPDWFENGLEYWGLAISHKMLGPYREFCRHFDGYGHILLYVGGAILNDACPAIGIPNGFFENDIKIRYGYEDNKSGWVNINPKKKLWTALSETGADYRFTLSDIPAFWEKRISEWDLAQNIDEMDMLNGKLEAVLGMIYTSQAYPIPIDLYNKIVNAQLLKHPEFIIDE